MVDFSNHESSEPPREMSSAFSPSTNVLPETEDARIDSKEVSRLSRLKRRTVTDHAATGRIPSAQQFGTKWTFDALTIRAWAKDPKGRTTTTTTTSTSAARGGGSARKSTDEKSVRAFERLAKKVARKRRNDRLRGLRAQAAQRGGLRKPLIDALVEFSAELEDGSKFSWAAETQVRYLVSMRAVARTLIDMASDNDFDLAGLHLDEVTTATIVDIVGRRIADASVSTANRDLAPLGHFFVYAKNREWISENPLKSFEKQGMTETLPPFVLPTDDAVKKMIGRSPITFGCLVRFIDFEGTRARETALLQWPDIEFDPVDQSKATATLRHTKGGEPRVLDLQPETVAMLRAMPRSDRSQYVFFNNGEEGWYKDVSTRFWEYGQDVEFGARLHDLRHRFAIRKLKEGGWSIYRVSAHLGHRSVLTTERYCFRYLTEEQRLRARRSGNNGFN